MPTRLPDALRDDLLRSLFAKSPTATEKIGLEVESGVLDVATGRGAPYDGPGGIADILSIAAGELDGELCHEGDNPMGVKLPGGGKITLEYGSAIEYASSPAADIATVVGETRAVLEHLAEIARDFGRAIVPGGIIPFNSIEDTPWVPKQVSPLMWDFFSRSGSVCGPTLMTLSLSTQVTLDYLDEQDLAEKLRLQVAASSVLGAVFVNSPLANGRLTGELSTRSRYWANMDPDRSGILSVGLCDRMRVADFIEWALGLPMIYYQNADQVYRAAPERSFGDLLREGFADGTALTPESWFCHLSQVWTDVRLRDTLELRGPDGPPYPYLTTIPALWVGLSYDRSARRAAWELLRHYTLADHEAARRELPARGLATRLGGDSVRELAGELLRLARAGLTARVASGVERADVLDYLDPVVEILDTGETFAARCARRWEGEFGRDPAKYVAAFRI